jgi:ornithine--oxo-acid transaminase
MCPPRFYDISYVINPWMAGNLHAASQHRATRQWNGLYKTLCNIAKVVLIEPHAYLPDMVFTANAGLYHGNFVIPTRFSCPERRFEETFFRRWFLNSGYTLIDLPDSLSFEGEGDALFSSDVPRLWAGWGMRTQQGSHAFLARTLGVEVISLRLVDPRFYHLDTCFAPLTDGYVMYYPGAFDAESLARIRQLHHPDRCIPVSLADASRFACNAIIIGRDILLNQVSRELFDRLSQEGFNVTALPLDEFIKAGGAAKCLVMQLRPGPLPTAD